MRAIIWVVWAEITLCGYFRRDNAIYASTPYPGEQGEMDFSLDTTWHMRPSDLVKIFSIPVKISVTYISFQSGISENILLFTW